MTSANRHREIRAVLLGLAAALFFTSTYVLNRAMASGGGHWAWSAALRYLFTLPLLAIAVALRGSFMSTWRALRAHPLPWLAWSTVGFGLFCVCLTWASAHAPAWLVAGTFQLTVVAGMLLGPILYRDERARLPRAALAFGIVIVLGVALMQGAHFHGRLDGEAWAALIMVAASAVLYPLGNRAILLHLERSGEPLDATQRVFGMTLASQPFWWLVAVYALVDAGTPPPMQLALAAGVALFTGVVATILFFHATGMVRDRPAALGAVEAMQAAELLFTSALGASFLGEPAPRGWSALGALLIVAGIVALGVLIGRNAAGDARAEKVLRSDRGA